MEDDIDWDIRIKEQLCDFATATQTLMQPASRIEQSSKSLSHADVERNSEFDLRNPPWRLPPKTSPYGDNWDLLWLGHCGMRFPFNNTNLPKSRVVWTDYTVPQQQYLWTISNPDDLKEQYQNHTRVVHCEYSHEHYRAFDGFPRTKLIFNIGQMPKSRSAP